MGFHSICANIAHAERVDVSRMRNFSYSFGIDITIDIAALKGILPFLKKGFLNYHLSIMNMSLNTFNAYFMQQQNTFRMNIFVPDLGLHS